MKKGLAGVLFFIWSVCALAQPKAYPIDSWHSKIGFSVKFGGLIDVEGRFTGFRGTIVYDEQNPADLSASVFIDPASVDTGVGPRDRHLRSEDFFGVEQYPRIIFSSKRTI